MDNLPNINKISLETKPRKYTCFNAYGSTNRCSNSTFLSRFHKPLQRIFTQNAPGTWSLKQSFKKDARWNRLPECKSAFNNINFLLSLRLLVTHYNPSLDIVVGSDDSDYGIRAIVSHIFLCENEKLVVHISRTLISTEHNYSQIEKEALVIVFAIKKIPLWSQTSLLLAFLVERMASQSTQPTTILLDYNFSIKYQSSQTDALSRLISSHRKLPEDTVVVVVVVSVEPEFVSALYPQSGYVENNPGSYSLRYRKSCDFTPLTVCADRQLQPFFQRRYSLSEVNGMRCRSTKTEKQSSQTISLQTSGNKPNETLSMQLYLLD